MDGDGGGALGGGFLYTCESVGVAVVGLRGFVVFIEGVFGACAAWHYEEAQCVGWLLQVLYAFGGKGYDAAGTDIPGIFIDGVVERLLGAAAEGGVVRHVVPVAARGEPHTAFGFACGVVDGLAYGCGEDLVAKEVFLVVGVGLRGFGVGVVEWATEAYTAVVGLACCGVDIGREGIAQFDGGFHVVVVVGVTPDSAVEHGALCGVGLEDGCEDTVL